MGMNRTASRPRLVAGGRFRTAIVAAVGISAFAGCRRAVFDIPPEQLADPVVSAVVATVQVGDASLLTVLGSTIGLSASARDSSGTVLVDRTFEWAMDTTGVVSLHPRSTTLYQNGAADLTALAEGRVEITASMEGVAATHVVDVVERARMEWSRPTMRHFTPGGGAALAEDGTLYVSAAEGLQAIAPDGSIRWRLPEPLVSLPAIGDDGTLYLTADDDLMAVAPDGAVLWTTPLEDSWSPPALGPDGTIYQVTKASTLYAVDPTGNVEWSFEAPGGALDRNWSPPAVTLDGTIYFGSEDDHLYAIDPDGTEQRRFQTEGDVRSPSIGVDGTIYFANDHVVTAGAEYVVHADSKLFALNPDGTERWSVTLEGAMYTAPAIGFDGTLYLASSNWISAFDPNGSPVWTHRPGTSRTPTVAGDGSVYVTSRSVRALDDEGMLTWEYGARNTSATAPVIGLDATIYAATSGGLDIYDIRAFTELGGSNGGYDSAPWPQDRGDRANSGRARKAPGPAGR